MKPEAGSKYQREGTKTQRKQERAKSSLRFKMLLKQQVRKKLREEGKDAVRDGITLVFFTALLPLNCCLLLLSSQKYNHRILGRTNVNHQT